MSEAKSLDVRHVYEVREHGRSGLWIVLEQSLDSDTEKAVVWTDGTLHERRIAEHLATLLNAAYGKGFNEGAEFQAAWERKHSAYVGEHSERSQP